MEATWRSSFRSVRVPLLLWLTRHESESTLGCCFGPRLLILYPRDGASAGLASEGT